MLAVSVSLAVRALAAAVVASTALFVPGGAAPAHADVAIEPPAVMPGPVVPFTMQVSNDRAPEATTRFELAFPGSPPIAWAEVVPVEGWSVRIERRTLDHPLDTPDGTANTGIAKLVWTGGPITGARFQRFTVRIGPLTTRSAPVVFKARQVYDSGRTVRFDEDPTSSTATRPSPVLDPSRYASSRPATAAAGTPDSPFNLAEKQAIDSRVGSLIRRGQVASPDDIEAGRWIALVALLVACAGLVFGVLAFVNTRRTRGEPAAPPAGDL